MPRIQDDFPGRRKFIKSTVGILGAISAGNFPRWAPLSTSSRASSNELEDSLLDEQTAVPDLVASVDQFDVGGGQMSWGYAYNSRFPGPIFEANRGDTVDIRFQNLLGYPTTVHWHGMVVPHAVDGHPHDLVHPGNSFVYEYPVIQRACLNWYHPHPHGMTGEQVNLGLAGGFIIRDEEESALGLPDGPYEIPLIIRDANFDNQGNLEYNAPPTGFMGNVILVNGKQNASMSIDAEVYRFRVLNGANSRVFRLSLSNGAAFTIIGNDGGLLEFPAEEVQIGFGPGERLDLLVDFRSYPIGTSIRLVDLNGDWDLIEFVVANADEPIFTVPDPGDRLSVIDPLGDPQQERNFTFAGSRINGEHYVMNSVDFEVPFGQTELWRFMTPAAAAGPHPVHVHGASFQVVSRSGGRDTLYPWESGWKDTVLVGNGETVEVLIRFDAYSDQLYMIHCHNLEHEDLGMMSNFRVLPEG